MRVCNKLSDTKITTKRTAVWGREHSAIQPCDSKHLQA